MYRYKLMALRLVGIKSPLEKSIQKRIDNLENTGMIEMMTHQFNRYKKVTHFTLQQAVWKSWVRR